MSLTSYRTAPSRVSFLSEPDFSCPENTNPATGAGLHRGPALGGRPRSARKAVNCKEKTCLQVSKVLRIARFGGPGSDLLSHVLRRSTISARGLNDRVRNGIGWGTPAITTGSAETGNGANSNMSLMLTLEHVPLLFLSEVF